MSRKRAEPKRKNHDQGIACYSRNQYNAHPYVSHSAGVAQLVEQLTCNQHVREVESQTAHQLTNNYLILGRNRKSLPSGLESYDE